MSSPEQGVSRYTLDPAASWIETADDGEWVRFTDYQAERERREGLEATATAQGAELHDADLRLQALEGVVEREAEILGCPDQTPEVRACARRLRALKEGRGVDDPGLS